MPPRALKPVGVALVDKPAGPSSFALVAALRRRTRARTGHAGTLDPFATGLLLLLSGAATRLAPCFVGLDKRYVTDIDLTVDDHDGRSGGRDRSRSTQPPAPSELDDALAALARRGRAADSRRVGGEDRRRARLQARPSGRHRRDAPAALDRPRARVSSSGLPTAPPSGSPSTSARAPTCVRSRRRSAATARRCGGRRSGRSS